MTPVMTLPFPSAALKSSAASMAPSPGHHNPAPLPHQVHNSVSWALPSNHGVQTLHQLPLSSALPTSTLGVRNRRNADYPVWPITLHANTTSGLNTAYRAELTLSQDKLALQWLHIPCAPADCRTLELKLRVAAWSCQQWCDAEILKPLVAVLNGIVHRGAMGACDLGWPLLERPMQIDVLVLSAEIVDGVVAGHTDCVESAPKMSVEDVVFEKLRLVFGHLCDMDFFQGKIGAVGVDVGERTAEFAVKSGRDGMLVNGRQVSCKRAIRRMMANGVFWGWPVEEESAEEDTLFVY